MIHGFLSASPWWPHFWNSEWVTVCSAADLPFHPACLLGSIILYLLSSSHSNFTRRPLLLPDLRSGRAGSGEACAFPGSGTGVTDNREPPCRCWEPSLGPRDEHAVEHAVFFTTGPSPSLVLVFSSLQDFTSRSFSLTQCGLVWEPHVSHGASASPCGPSCRCYPVSHILGLRPCVHRENLLAVCSHQELLALHSPHR